MFSGMIPIVNSQSIKIERITGEIKVKNCHFRETKKAIQKIWVLD
jgi:hypothetical protein